MQFNAIPLMPEVQKALHDLNYETPTPIQQEAIPLALQGRDILATAQTGTGKTAAFALPIIHMVAQGASRQGIRALILTPTRELAIQIDDNIKDYCKYLQLKHKVIFGGVKQHSQVQALQKGVDILVATPGRLLDLHGQGLLDLKAVQHFVLDEADRMLDMGFINDIRKIIKIIPAKRQTLFFSATLAGNIKSLSKELLTNPATVSVDPPSSTAEKVSQHLYYTNKSSKDELLIHIIKKWEIEQAIVFTRTKHGADKLVKVLRKYNLSAAALHGGKAQNNRERTLSDFKSGKVGLLVATDIAARGIDIDKLGHVINYEIPNESEAYVHRIGRSGRAGEDGIAISISEPEENQYVRDIEKLMGQKIDVISENPFPQTDKPMTEAEKKEWNRQKEERKRELIKALREKRNGQSGSISKKKSPDQKATQNQGNQVVKAGGEPRKEHQKSKHKSNNKSRRGPISTEAKSLKDKYMWPLG